MEMPTVSNLPFIQTFKRLKWLSCITWDWKGQGWLSSGLQILSWQPGRIKKALEYASELPLYSWFSWLLRIIIKRKQMNIFRVPHNTLPLSQSVYLCRDFKENQWRRKESSLSEFLLGFSTHVTFLDPRVSLPSYKPELLFPVRGCHTHQRASLCHDKTHPPK